MDVSPASALVSARRGAGDVLTVLRSAGSERMR
jgi:hypothetical protein